MPVIRRIATAAVLVPALGFAAVLTGRRPGADRSTTVMSSRPLQQWTTRRHGMPVIRRIATATVLVRVLGLAAVLTGPASWADPVNNGDVQQASAP